MRVLIIGSDGSEERLQGKCLTSELTEDETRFRHFCFILGKEMATRDFELIIGSDESDTADVHVALGVSNAGGKIRAAWPKDKKAGGPKIDGIDGDRIRCESVQSGRTAGRVEQLNISNAAISIRGGAKTKEILPLCIATSIPILPIPHFGGASEEAFDDLLKYVEGRNPSLTRSLLNYQRRPSNRDSTKDNLTPLAKETLKLVDEIRKENPFYAEAPLREGIVFLTISSLVIFSLISMWASYTIKWMIFVLASWFFSILLGSCAGAFFDNDINRFGYKKTFSKIMRNSAGASILSVALFAVLLILQFPTTGNFEMKNYIEDGSDYLRVALLSFVIGFACAWQRERWIDRLRSGLDRIAQ